MKYAHLHVHSVYSLKDSIAKPIDYVRRIHEYNNSQSEHEITALAITEHGNNFSTILHHESCCKDIGGKTLKPLYGNEIYHVDDLDKFQGDRVFNYDDLNLNHLVLIAKNDKGLENLFSISSHAGENKFKTSEKKSAREYMTTDLKYILSHGKGIIGLSACLGGKIAKLIISGKYEKAKALALTLNKYLDEFYLEIQPHDMLPEQILVNEALIKMSKETGLKLVITTDSHYVYEEDKKYHDLLKTINYSTPYTTKAHLWTVDELVEWCNNNKVPLEAIENTAKIAKECTADITPKDKKGLMPDFPCPDGHDENSYLIEVVNEGLKHRFETNNNIVNVNEYVKRLNYELDIITQMGYSGYFLILWDWFKWCKENKIPLGPGRGSGAGSLVAYCLDITKIDPIQNGLMFERFLNPSRLDEPDVDTDISKTHRAKAIKYLLEKYGKNYVCQIATFGEYRLKNTIKLVLSNIGFDGDSQNEITKQIPSKLGELEISYNTIVDIVENPDEYLPTEKINDREYSEAVSCYNMLQNLFQKHPEVKDAIEHLKGTIASVGIHAGGVVISRKILSYNIPTMNGSDTAILKVCQTNMDGIHFLKGLKIDALGLKTLSQIRLCMDLAELEEKWLECEDTFEPEIYEFLKQGNTANIFQMSRYRPTKMIKDFKVDTLEGLIAVNAGNRPGPLAEDSSGKSLVDRYTEAVKTGVIEKLDDRIDYILAPTMGQLWYQEQCMELGQIMAGYSLGDADLRIRKVIAKKLKNKIPEVRNEFIYGKKSIYKYDEELKKDVYVGISEDDSPLCIGSIRNGFSEELAIKIFDKMESFASYAFNKSHSAAYGFLAYKTAWLSYHYPIEWCVACLTLDSIDGDKDKIITTLNSCKKRGLKLLPPDINTSSTGFTVAKLPNGEKAIRYGLLAIKDVGESVSNTISLLIKEDGPFTSFYDFIDRTIGRNNTTLKKYLISIGKYNVKEKDGVITKTIKTPFSKRNIVPLILSGAFDNLDENRHKLFNEYMTFKKEKDFKDENNFLLKDKLAYELEYLGYYVSQHPLEGPAFPYVDLNTAYENQSVTIAGILKDCVTAKTKKGDKFYKIRIETKDGSTVNVKVFKGVYNKHPECVQGLSGKRAKEGKEILIVKGKYSVLYNSINAYEVLKVRGTEDLENDEVAVDEQLKIIKDTIGDGDITLRTMDDDLFFKVDR